MTGFAPVMTRAASRLVMAGILTAIIDGLFSSVLALAFYGSTVTRLWQGVASTLIGKQAFDGGLQTALLGLLMHVCVAFGWSAVFLLITIGSPWIRRTLVAPYGALRVAVFYGPFVWLVMSRIVVPLLTHQTRALNARWWVQLIGHIPFVGLPIVASIATGILRPDRRPATPKSQSAPAT